MLSAIANLTLIASIMATEGGRRLRGVILSRKLQFHPPLIFPRHLLVPVLLRVVGRCPLGRRRCLCLYSWSEGGAGSRSIHNAPVPAARILKKTQPRRKNDSTYFVIRMCIFHLWICMRSCSWFVHVCNCDFVHVRHLSLSTRCYSISLVIVI